MELLLRWSPEEDGKKKQFEFVCRCWVQVRKWVLSSFNTDVYVKACGFPSEWMGWKGRDEVETLARGMLTVFNKHSRNISEFVVLLHCFFFYWVNTGTLQAFFQNNSDVIDLIMLFNVQCFWEGRVRMHGLNMWCKWLVTLRQICEEFSYDEDVRQNIT